MTWGMIGGAAVSVVGGSLLGKHGGQSQQQAQASQAADPFASQRWQYQVALNNLMNGGYSMSQDPNYQYQLQQGSENLSRQMAAQHMFGSGAQMAELQKYGQNLASADWSNQFNRLAQLAGANVGSPAAAGQIMANQQSANQGAFSTALGTIGNAAGQGIANWFNSPSASSGNDISGGFAASYGSNAGGYDMSFGGNAGSFF